jgi:hypothetical protein
VNITKPTIKHRARPSLSPVFPAISRKLAKTIVYASTIHCSWVLEAPSSRTKLGSATLTIVPSMPTMSNERHMTASTAQRRGSRTSVPGWRASGRCRLDEVATAPPRDCADGQSARPVGCAAEVQCGERDGTRRPIVDVDLHRLRSVL